MSRYLLPLLVVAACSSPPVEKDSAYGTPAYLDIENGFRGVRFGSGPEELKNAGVVWQRGGDANYEQDNEAVKADSINPLVYWDYRRGRLYSIDYSAYEGRTQIVLAELRKRYGPEKTSNDTLYWNGKEVKAKAFFTKDDSPLLFIRITKP